MLHFSLQYLCFVPFHYSALYAFVCGHVLFCTPKNKITKKKKAKENDFKSNIQTKSKKQRKKQGESKGIQNATNKNKMKRNQIAEKQSNCKQKKI